MSSKKSSKWYNNAVWVNILLILFFPVGLYGLWKSESIANWWKVTASILIVFSVVRNFNSFNEAQMASALNEEPKTNRIEKLKVSSKPALTEAQKDSIRAEERAFEKQKRQQSTIKAEVLFKAYRDNEIMADRKYKDKTFYVVGYIEDIGKDILDDMYITLKSNEFLFGVQCYIDDEDVVANLRKGRKVTVYGTCDGKFGSVSMKNCRVVVNLEDL